VAGLYAFCGGFYAFCGAPLSKASFDLSPAARRQHGKYRHQKASSSTPSQNPSMNAAITSVYPIDATAEKVSAAVENPAVLLANYNTTIAPVAVAFTLVESSGPCDVQECWLAGFWCSRNIRSGNADGGDSRGPVPLGLVVVGFTHA
jgi:hypothetical protein